jgi:cardiolipin synthase
MFKGGWRQLPNAISSARLLATPVVLFAAVAKHEDLFKWLLLACMLSDILDGLIARIFQLRSPLGARLDSIADMIVFVIALFGLYVFQAEVLARHWLPLGLIVALYVLETAGALWRYGRISSFHTILVRIAAYAQGIFVMSLFLWGYVSWMLYAMTAITVLAYGEEIILLFLLPEWTADVRGVYWVLTRPTR